MAESAFRGAIAFMDKIGIFDVVLPFLLVFTLVFAFLEKTKVFGTEQYRSEVDGKHYEVTRKNLNSMIAFTIAFFVVASTKLVSIVSEVTSNVVLLIILVFSFTLTVGAFQKETKEGFFLNKTWTIVFEVIVFLGIILIFLNALKGENGDSWLDIAFDYINDVWTSEAVATVIMILLLFGFLLFITWDPTNKAKQHKDKEEKG